MSKLALKKKIEASSTSISIGMKVSVKFPNECWYPGRVTKIGNKLGLPDALVDMIGVKYDDDDEEEDCNWPDGNIILLQEDGVPVVVEANKVVKGKVAKAPTKKRARGEGVATNPNPTIDEVFEDDQRMYICREPGCGGYRSKKKSKLWRRDRASSQRQNVQGVDNKYSRRDNIEASQR